MRAHNIKIEYLAKHFNIHNLIMATLKIHQPLISHYHRNGIQLLATSYKTLWTLLWRHRNRSTPTKMRIEM